MKTLNFFYINFKNYHNKFSEICGNDNALLHKFDANRVSSFKKLWFYWQSIYIHLNVHRKQFIQIQQCFQMLPGTILEKCSFSALSLDFSACLSTKLRLSHVAAVNASVMCLIFHLRVVHFLGTLNKKNI